MNKDKIIELIKAICWHVTQESGYVNKTKLIKYLYLIDVEYYRNHGKTFTEFPWIFYEFGPWAEDYNTIYHEMKRSPYFKIKTGSSPDFDTEFISTTEDVDLSSIFDDVDDELISKRIVKQWATEKLGEMLNHVYFYTEPMIDAERYKPLDFSKIEETKKIQTYTRKSSETTKKQIEAARKIFEQFKIEKEKKQKHTSLPTPRYDDVYWEAVRIMEEDNDY